MPEKEYLQDMLTSGAAGVVTGFLHSVSQGVAHTWKSVLLHVLIGAAVVYLAILVTDALEVGADMSKVIIFCAGYLNRTVLDEIVKKWGALIDDPIKRRL